MTDEPTKTADIEQEVEQTRKLVRNRIVGNGMRGVDEIYKNPLNWRLHPKEQEEALQTVLEDIGWAQQVVVTQKGVLIDGHLRLKLAKKMGETEIPVVVVDLTDEEASIILTTMDAIAGMAITDRVKLDGLLKEAKSATDDDRIKKMLDDMRVREKVQEAKPGPPKRKLPGDKDVDTLEDVSGTLEGVHGLFMSVAFVSDEPWEMPPLLKEKCLSVPENLGVYMGPKYEYPEDQTFLYIWGSDSIKGMDTTRAVVCFYTDDYRFEPFWADPANYVGKLLNAKVKGAIMPNFSMWFAIPAAHKLWQRYRSLWMARYMQEAGLMVMPEVQLSYMLPYEILKAGIPHGVDFAIQFHVKNEEEQWLAKMDVFNQMLDDLDPPHVLIYADENGWKRALECNHPEKLVYVKNRVSLRREYMNEVKNEAL